MIEDAELLRRYVEDRSEAAFTDLVRRHLDLVYSAACRQMGGDVHRAHDVAQMVFADLARKAPALSRHTALVGWLYTSTHFAAAKLRRTEQRRHAREQEAHAMQQILASPTGDADWERLHPVLDAAMHELNRRDREAVLLRFFEKRSFGDVGRHLGLGENAARMAVERALEKLGGLLAKRGVTSTAAALSLVLVNQAVAAAPGGMVTTVATGALGQVAAVAGGAGFVATTVQIMSTTKLLTTAGVAALLAIGATVFYVGQTARAAADLADANRASADWRSRLRGVDGRIAALQPAADARAKVAAITAPAANDAPETASEKIMREMMTDPLAMRLRAQRDKEARGRQSGLLYRELGWTEAQITQFEARLESALAEDFRVQGGAQLKGREMALGPEATEKLRQVRIDFERDLRGMFGDAALERFLEHERLDAARHVAADVAAKVFFTETPLAPAQSDALIRILAANSPQYGKGEAVSWYTLDWDRVMGQAGSVLQPVQLTALRAIRTRVDFEIKRDKAVRGETTATTP